MSLRIDNSNLQTITAAPSNGIAFKKTNPIPNDSVEISSEKKDLSTGEKIGIAAGVLSAIALGIELIGYKGRHLKKIWEKGKGKTEEIGKTAKPETIRNIADFKNINEAKEYFEEIGIKTIFKDGAEKHLSDLNNIKNDLVIMGKNGIALPKPESIVVSDWHNKEELKQILRSINAKEEKAEVCKQLAGYWGTVEKGTDNKCHVLINSSFEGNYGKFIHEMGHIHQDFLKSSYWHSKGLNNKEFMQKQMEVLGLSHIKLNPNFDTESEYLSSILRAHTAFNEYSPTSAIERCKRMFSNITENDYNKVFVISDINEKTYYINAKKMVDKMAAESNVYAPTKTWENVAEIFQGLNNGKEYSDLVMLMYDINGGGRVPNRIIKGMKYDDYIESLYNNKELVRQLRECIEVKQIP